MINVDERGYSSSHAGYMKRHDNVAVRKNPSFSGGRIPTVAVPSTSLKDAVEYILPNSAKILRKLGSNGGEIQNIIINAVGTGLVAPVFIKYNFLSEADEDTRTYSAWRQPVSAVLAIVTQAGLTAPFYKIFDNYANNGTFGEELNRTLFQDDYYIEKKMKKLHPKATKQQIGEFVKQEKEIQRANLIRSLSDKSTVYYRMKDGSSVKISDTAYCNLLNSTIDKLAKTDKKMLDNVQETINKRTARSKYYRTHGAEATRIFKEVKSKISEASSLKEFSSYLTGKIKELKKQPEQAEMVSILTEIRNRSRVTSGSSGTIPYSAIQEALRDKIQKMQTHVQKYQGVATDKEVEEIVEKIVEKETYNLREAGKFYSMLKKTINEKTTIESLNKKIIEKCRELNIEDSGLNKNFINEVADQLIARSKTNMKWYKQFVGVFVSLSILPVTCTLLNWIYPRFMDVFFPNLSSKKHEKETDKLVLKAPKANVSDNTSDKVPEKNLKNILREKPLTDAKTKVEVA